MRLPVVVKECEGLSILPWLDHLTEWIAGMTDKRTGEWGVMLISSPMIFLIVQVLIVQVLIVQAHKLFSEFGESEFE